MPRPCNHPWHHHGCPACTRCLEHTDLGRFYRQRWDEPEPSGRGVPGRCRHLGKATGEMAECGTCRGRVALKLFTCAIHKECTLTKHVPGTACCRDCPDRQLGRDALDPATLAPVWLDDPVWVNHGAGGIGDALLGMAAVAGIKRNNPGRAVVYAAPPGSLPWVHLFDGGWDGLAEATDAASSAEPVQLNAGYGSGDWHAPRWERYARNAGGCGCVLPRVRDHDALRVAGAAYAGAVLLSPFSVFGEREYPLAGWLACDALLRSKGYRTVVLDGRTDRCGGFPGERLLGASPAVVAAAVSRAACLVGNDSGMMHLAGCLGTPGVALCGPTRGVNVFGFYPSVRCIQSAGRAVSVSIADILRGVDAICLPVLTGGRSLLGADKLVVLRDLVLETNNLPGDVAEVGVYKGGSAKLIGHFAPDAVLHLFDTFSGMPADDDHPDGAHKVGDFADCDEAGVLDFLANPRAVVHTGVFPDTSLPNAAYRFVHIDADLYGSTCDALAYFWLRLVPGGVLLLDDLDWHRCPGVRAALTRVLPGVAVGMPTPNQGIVHKERENDRSV